MPQIMNEETPLLGDQESLKDGTRRQKTPLPLRQFSILLLLQVSESAVWQIIAPFLPQLIRDIGVTDGQDSRVGYYVGLIHSLFYLTEACTVFHWSRISDQIGRKPVLLTGLFGLTASMWCFGLSKTFWTLVLSRCLDGALNGNIGVMKSMTIEMTDSTNIAQAYGILPISWYVGATVGPLIGGSLAKPAERFPEILGDSAFLKEYPYFLPCSVSAIISASSWFIVFLFMQETTKPRMKTKQYIFSGATKGGSTIPDSQAWVRDTSVLGTTDDQLPFRSLLVRPVIIAAASYATFSLIDIAFYTFMPVFYAMPMEIGGLDLGPATIGTILSLLGMLGGVIQWLFFAPLYDCLGAKRFFLVSVSLCIPTIALFPAIHALARMYGLSHLVWFLVVLQLILLTFTNFSYSISFMFIGAAAPNKASIGATNGIAQMAVSVMRATGPIVINSAFSLGIEKHIMGGNFAYVVMMAMAGLTLWVGYLLPRSLQDE